jgi:hypothetical protein
MAKGHSQKTQTRQERRQERRERVDKVVTLCEGAAGLFATYIVVDQRLEERTTRKEQGRRNSWSGEDTKLAIEHAAILFPAALAIGKMAKMVFEHLEDSNDANQDESESRNGRERGHKRGRRDDDFIVEEVEVEEEYEERDRHRRNRRDHAERRYDDRRYDNRIRERRRSFGSDDTYCERIGW